MRRGVCHRGPTKAFLGASAAPCAVLSILAAAMGALSVLSLLARAAFLRASHAPELVPCDITTGDALLWALLGNPIGCPPEWAATCAVILAGGAIGGGGLGVAPIVSCGDRRRCWRSMCAAAVARTVAAYGAFLVGAALASLLAGCSPSLAARSISALSLWTVTGDATGSGELLMTLLVMALGFASLACVQRALGLVAGRLAAFAAVTALVLGSAFAPLLPLPGSLLMVSRLEPFAASGLTMTEAWHPWVALSLFLAMAVAALICGGACFVRHDLGLMRDGL